MKKLLIIAGLLLAFASPQFANAEPTDPIVRGTLDVAIDGVGKVTGTGIDCPGDCTQEESWRESEIPPTNRLTAVPTVTGWAFQSWNGCTPLPADRTRCDASYGEVGGDPVVARFVDVMAPSVFLNNSIPAAASGELPVNITTSDNDRVSKVEYAIDDVVVATLNGPAWNATLNVSALGEGVHNVKAKAYDPTGNVGITAARGFTVDRTGPEVTFNDPVTATNLASPQFSFTSTSPDYLDAGCVIQKPASSDLAGPCQKDVYFSSDVPSEGDWEFVVIARDNLGNRTIKTHPFVVDRTAPVLAFTSGPADGATVEKGNVTYEWSVADSLDVTQKCSFDGGEEVACAGTSTKSLVKGAHVFNLQVTDLAGNSSFLSRTVNVRQDGNPDPDPDPDPDPNPNPNPDADKTAPTVTLASKKQKLKALKAGLKVKVVCSEACAGRLVAKARGGVKFTGTVSLPAAGKATVVLKPNAKAKKAIKASPKSLKLTVNSSLADKAGNSTSSKLKTKVRR